MELLNDHPGAVLELLAEKAVDKLIQPEKEELRKMLFLFWELIRLFELRLSPKQHLYFHYFYKEFYQEFPFLKYKVEESYNITDKEYFPIFLKVKNVDGQLIKRNGLTHQVHFCF